MKTTDEIEAEVMRQAKRIARDRFDEIQDNIQENWSLDNGWPFQGGDYPWLCELAKRAIDAGLILDVGTKLSKR